MRKILAVDPGLKQSGLVLIDSNPTEFRVLRSYLPKSVNKDWLSVSEDIVTLTIRWFVDFCKTLADYEEFDLVIEEPFMPVFARSGAFAKQNRLFGALIQGFSKSRVHNIYSVNPKSMKKIFTGNGSASKPQVMKRASLYYAISMWPVSKADKEALADAIGIGYALWKHRQFKRNGVNLIRGVK